MFVQSCHSVGIEYQTCHILTIFVKTDNTGANLPAIRHTWPLVDMRCHYRPF
jgi:hypothetical protein